MKGLYLSDNLDFSDCFKINTTINHLDLMVLCDTENVKENISSKLSDVHEKVFFLDSAKLVDSKIDEIDHILETIEDSFIGVVGSNKFLKNCFTFGNQKNGFIFSDLSERNPYKSDYIFKLAQLKTILDYLECNQYDFIYVSMKNYVLENAIVEFLQKNSFSTSSITIFNSPITSLFIYYFRHFIWIAKTLLYFLRSVFRASYTRFYSYFIKVNNVQSSEIVLISYFPLVKNEDSRVSKFQNQYFFPLQKYFSESGKKIKWVFIYINNNKFNFFSANKLANRLVKDEYCFIDENFSIKDWFIVLFEYIKCVTFFLLRKNQLKRGISQINELNHYGISLPMYYFEKSLLGIPFLSSISYYYMFQGVSKKFNEKIHTVIYLNEMQNWEKSMNLVFKENSLNITTIGFQHTSVSHRLFSYTKNRVKNNTLDPLPSFFAVNGSFAFKLLSKSVGENLVNVEAIRHFEHFKLQKLQNININKNRKVLIVGSYDTKETRLIINSIMTAFKTDKGFDIVIKQHPSGEVTKNDRIKVNENLNIQVSNESISDLLVDAKVVIVGSSTSCIDALVFNCMVVIPIFSDVLCINPLLNEHDLVYKTFSSKELRARIVDLLDSELSYKQIAHKKKFLEDFWHIDFELKKWKKLI